ncbi:MAG: cation-translocating P-type ATPase [Roseiflexus sp.]|uniref:heavy metal translocating P-type ATPase n=1 Tax=Roseiflexus sp. TaxID=2562120 RepID=UPI0025FDEB6B|nr:cation-translocating P-type ATPase [Roseiflexus sp.]MCL6542559.1 cation-translocating P-type ATPase [Roseiflexus sp.]
MQTRNYIFAIHGIDCAHCANTIEVSVARLDGIEACELNATTGRLRVRGAVEPDAIITYVRSLGYEAMLLENDGATPTTPDASVSFVEFMWQRLETRLALIGAIMIVPGVVLHELLGWRAFWIDALAFAALIAAGLPIARSAWRSLVRSRTISINALMTIAAIGAVIIGAHVEAALVMVLFAIGEAIEGFTAARARDAIRSLMTLVPETALRLRDGYETRTPVAELKVGDVIVVRPGERVPMDGVVRSGATHINQAPITGESVPVVKTPGAEVYAGSINGEGVIEVIVTHLASDNTISRMIRLVQEAQDRRAPVQRLIDRFAGWYTPAVVAIAALIAVIPPLLFGQPFWNPSPDEFGWFYRSLALLVVACPCALVISTPVSVVSALSAAARAGVLIKGGAALEALGKVRAVAFDKTGTLTTGRPVLVAVRSVECREPEQNEDARCDACTTLLELACAVEQRSEHPLAHAIVDAARVRGVMQNAPRATSVTALPGHGIVGDVNGRTVLIGSHRYFDETAPHPLAFCDRAERDAGAGRTPLMVSIDGTFAGMLSVADAIRPEAREAIARLRRAGIQHAVMLTGDRRETAQAIAADAGIDDVRAEVLPEYKAQMVENLRATYGAVAMVGDGINDTPALASATVGIAIGAAHGGTNQAMETADVTLMSDDLRRLPFVFELARATRRTIMVNVAFSIAVKAVFLVIVAAGLSTMWMAVFADMGTSLLVTLNGLRLLGMRHQGEA